MFLWQLVKVLNVFNSLTWIQIFWKTNTFFKKLEYSFLVETTMIENTSFPFKTAHKEWSFAGNYFIFLENLFVLEPLKNS